MSAKQIIFTAPNQPPPIGTERPFAGLAELLRLNLNPGSFPRICGNYEKLTVNRRQRSHSGHLELSRLSAGAEDMPGSDAIAKIEKSGGKCRQSTRIRYDGMGLIPLDEMMKRETA